MTSIPPDEEEQQRIRHRALSLASGGGDGEAEVLYYREEPATGSSCRTVCFALPDSPPGFPTSSPHDVGHHVSPLFPIFLPDAAQERAEQQQLQEEHSLTVLNLVQDLKRLALLQLISASGFGLTVLALNPCPFNCQFSKPYDIVVSGVVLCVSLRSLVLFLSAVRSSENGDAVDDEREPILRQSKSNARLANDDGEQAEEGRKATGELVFTKWSSLRVIRVLSAFLALFNLICTGVEIATVYASVVHQSSPSARAICIPVVRCVLASTMLLTLGLTSAKSAALLQQKQQQQEAHGEREDHSHAV